jgi:chorismate synthase
MKNTIGTSITMTLFGESHGPAIGVVIDGLPAGAPVNLEHMQARLDKRRASGTISTARHEADVPQILSGVKDGHAEGTPVAILIPNENVRRQDYDRTKDLARPSHADYTAQAKYRGWQDASGGGHFSGRLTAPLTAAGSIFLDLLEAKNIHVATHIADLAGILDDPFDEAHLKKQMNVLKKADFPVLNAKQGDAMKAAIEEACMQQDSVGGILESVVTGLEAGVGEPEFDSVESLLAHAVFSIPAVKGMEFGSGFALAHEKGSQANDAFYVKNGQVRTRTNHSGGINGGIANGMPIVFRTVIKPTASIAQPQETVNYRTNRKAVIRISGRHDPAIIHRAAIVVDAMTAFTVADLLQQRHGETWFTEACR